MNAGRLLLFPLTSCVLGGCLMNSAHQMGRNDTRVSGDRAVIIFGVGDDTFASGQTGVEIQLDEFSLKTGRITGNCFNYNRMNAEMETEPNRIVYFAFSAPPGYYVLSPFRGQATDADMNFAFSAPAGGVTYLGDFTETGGEPPLWHGPVKRQENLADATAFATNRGLPGPSAAAVTPIAGRGAIFVCTP